MAKLRLEGISKKKGALRVLHGINLTLDDGKLFSVVGPNGSGKTTLIRIIAGLEQPDEGRVFLDGQDITLKPPEMRECGIVFQSLALFPHLTVSENLGFGLKARNVREEEIQNRIHSIAESLEINSLNKRVTELSGGEQQKVALGRAIIIAPKILLLDESFSKLDPSSKARVRAFVEFERHRNAITTISVSHDHSEALESSDIIGVLNKGQFEQVDTPEEIYENPATFFVATFVGHSNFFEGTFVDSTERFLKFKVNNDRFLHVSKGSLTPKVGAIYHLAARFEKTIITKDQPSWTPDNFAKGEVTKRGMLGGEISYRVSSELGEIGILSKTVVPEEFKVGETVFCAWQPESLFICERG